MRGLLFDNQGTTGFISQFRAIWQSVLGIGAIQDTRLPSKESRVGVPCSLGKRWVLLTSSPWINPGDSNSHLLAFLLRLRLACTIVSVGALTFSSTGVTFPEPQGRRGVFHTPSYYSHILTQLVKNGKGAADIPLARS